MSITAKDIIKKIAPNIFIKGYKYIKKYISKDSLDIEDISTFSSKFNLNINKEGVIIGNGPSLAETLKNHLDFFKDKTVFCVNNFVSSEYFEQVRPSFYVFADPLLTSEKNCSPGTLEYREKMYDELRIRVKWKMFLALPSIAREWNCFLNLPNENENISLIYYNSKLAEGSLNEKHKLYKNNLGMPHFQTVLVSAVFLSLNLGFKVNYVVGGDMSMHRDIFVNNDNVVCNYDKHFYDKGKPNGNPYWKNEANHENWHMDELFLAYSRMFKGFVELEEYSKFLEAKIYNASHNSFIDAFERYDLS